MPQIFEEPTSNFNLKLATECADAFCASTGIGCTVSDLSGNVLHNVGYSCAQCGLFHYQERSEPKTGLPGCASLWYDAGRAVRGKVYLLLSDGPYLFGIADSQRK